MKIRWGKSAKIDELIPRNFVADQRVFALHHTRMSILEERFLRVFGYRINRRPDEKINFSQFKPLIHTLIQALKLKLDPGSLPEIWKALDRAEVSTFPQFLPDLYRLWHVVKDPAINRQCSLRRSSRAGH